MSKPRLRIDPGLVVAILVATFAAWPFLTRPGLPTATDADIHIYRTHQILTAWDLGVLHTRWAPDLAYGFGYPIFNYYTPLTYYLGAAYGRFFGGPVAGVKFVLVVAAYLGALGMYLFVRDRWGSVAGIVGAAAFALAPYIVFIDPHGRGAAPETLAIAFGPPLLWSFGRLRRTASPGDVTLAAITLAALSLSHNLMSFVFTAILVIWLAWEIAWERLFQGTGAGTTDSHTPHRPAIRPPGAALLLGASLAAFMWLPATLEREAVQFQRAFKHLTGPDAPLYFVSAQELLGPASTADLGELQPPGWKFRLGVPQLLLGALGLLTAFRAQARRSTVLFFAAVAVGLTFLVLPSSERLWRVFPVLIYLQLSWRLLGPVAVALGVLAGAATRWIPSGVLPWQRGRFAFGLVAIVACIAGAMPLLDPLPWADYGPVDPLRIFLYEQSGTLGTTVQNEFLPSSVEVMPEPQDSLRLSYNTGLVDKVNHATVPEGTQVTVLEHGPNHDRFQITGQSDFDLGILTFYFPGWTAYVDSTKTPIAVSEPNGFMRLRVPAGAHTVLLRLENTLPRRLGWIISGLGLIATLGLLVWQLRRGFDFPRSEPLAWRHAAVVGLVLFVAMGVRYAADQASPWRIDLSSDEVPGAQHQRFEQLEGNIALVAYDLLQTTAHPGDQVPLTLYWKAAAQAPLDLSVFVHFISPDGQLWGQSDKVRPAYFPTDRWPLNRYVQDDHLAILRLDAPPGDYQVIAGLWDRYSGARMRVLGAKGNVTDQDGIVLTTKFVVQP